MQIIRLPIGINRTNCYILSCQRTKEAVILDPCGQVDKIVHAVERYQIRPVAMLATNGSYSYIVHARELQDRYAIPFHIHPEDEPLLHEIGGRSEYLSGGFQHLDAPIEIQFLHPGMVISFGNVKLEVLLTNTYTPGSVSFYDRDRHALFCGNVINPQKGVGVRTYDLRSDLKRLKIIETILNLPQHTKLYPGYGHHKTVADEQSKWAGLGRRARGIERII